MRTSGRRTTRCSSTSARTTTSTPTPRVSSARRSAGNDLQLHVRVVRGPGAALRRPGDADDARLRRSLEPEFVMRRHADVLDERRAEGGEALAPRIPNRRIHDPVAALVEERAGERL